MRQIALMLVVVAAVLTTACETEEQRITREFTAAAAAWALQADIIDDYRFDLLTCAENHARTLYFGGDEYYAVTLDDLEYCAY